MLHLNLPFAGSFPVTQAFGIIADPNSMEPPAFVYPDGSGSYYYGDGTARRVDHFHCGRDLGLPLYTPILAPADGTVAFAGTDRTGFGQCITLDHGDVSTLYGHLSIISVLTGQTVKAGQVIGRSGSTGNSTGPHLHFSVFRTVTTPIGPDRRYVDPAPYLAAPPPPPPDPMTHVRFTVTVQDGDVNIRQGPTTHSANLGQIAGGIAVQCDGWQRGQAILDPTTGKRDARWYHLADNAGWISSAHVLGNAPNSQP